MKTPLFTLFAGVSFTAAAIAAPASYQTAVTANNPYVYYRLAETTGTTAGDSSVNARNGVYIGGPTLAVAGAGTLSDTAASFAGPSNGTATAVATQYVSSSATGFGSFLGTSTFEFVLRPANSNTIESIFGDFNTGTVTGVQITLNQATNGGNTVLANSVRFFLRDDGGITRGASFTNPSLFDGNYHHLAITYGVTTGGAGTLTAYLDGVSQTITTTAAGNPGSANAFSVFGFSPTFGARNNRGVFNDPYNGALDEIALYGTVLSASEVFAHAAAAGLAVPEPGTVTLLGLTLGLSLCRRGRSRQKQAK